MLTKYHVRKINYIQLPDTRNAGILSILTLLTLTYFGLSTSSGQTQTPTTITPISLTTTLGTSSANAYSQDFNTLAQTNTSSTLPAGFGFTETATTGATTYTAGTGSSTTGDTFSFGSVAVPTDRAFGSLQSGSNVETFGFVFTNNTGTLLTGLTISYAGEQWRLGATSRVDRLDFSYNLGATSLTATGFTDYDALDFTAPTTTGTVGALDGNATGNRTVLTSTISNLSIANGTSFTIRFSDFNATGADDGLAIDDFSFYATPVPEPSTWIGGGLILGLAAFSQRKRLGQLVGA